MRHTHTHRKRRQEICMRTGRVPTPAQRDLKGPSIFICFMLISVFANTVESRSNGPARDGNTHITEAIIQLLERFLFNFYIGSNKNPLITDPNSWSLEIH